MNAPRSGKPPLVSLHWVTVPKRGEPAAELLDHAIARLVWHDDPNNGRVLESGRQVGKGGNVALVEARKSHRGAAARSPSAIGSIPFASEPAPRADRPPSPRDSVSVPHALGRALVHGADPAEAPELSPFPVRRAIRPIARDERDGHGVMLRRVEEPQPKLAVHEHEETRARYAVFLRASLAWRRR